MATKTTSLSNEDVRPRMEVVVVEEDADETKVLPVAPPTARPAKSDAEAHHAQTKTTSIPQHRDVKPAKVTTTTAKQPVRQKKAPQAPAPLPSSEASDVPISEQEEEQRVQFRYGLIAFVFLVVILIMIVLLVSGLNG